MTSYAELINQQYSRAGLNARILDAFTRDGTDIDALTLDDLSRFDQLHSGGREATRLLANLAGIKPGMRVLDIGSGIGGPARTLAADFGCQVIGLDITEEYVHAAQMLTKRVGLSDQVTFFVGNAPDLKFGDAEFDAVWTQNAIMNIEDKRTLFREAFRVLREEGILALEAFMAGPNDEMEFPVYWADHPGLSFLVSPDDFRQMMAKIGFHECLWKDVTQVALDRIHNQEPIQEKAPPPIGLDILYTDVPRKGENTLRGLENGAYVDNYGLFERPKSSDQLD
jgi:SAM-dependent methyltransferase